MSQTSKTVAILNAQSAGYSAYLNGKHIPDCPYTSDQPELQHAWARGYAMSRTDRARANTNADIPHPQN